MAIIQSREEDPPRDLDIEASIVNEPPARLRWRSVDQASDPRHPPAVDLEWPKIEAAIRIGNLSNMRNACRDPSCPASSSTRT